MATKKKVLICPLDWGLGHATRCMPLIDYLLNLGHEVQVATSGNAYHLIRKNHPEITIHRLPSYDVTYGTKASSFIINIAIQIPKILNVIRQEHKAISALQSIEQYDIIISDNRYGVYQPKVHSIFMTHQVQILSGINSFCDKILLLVHNFWLRRYNKVWIVDHHQPSMAIAPKLSHAYTDRLDASHIGHLSQLEAEQNTNDNIYRKNKILILLSGPEPMRSLLEEIIIKQAEKLHQYTFTIISGADKEIITTSQHINYQKISNKQAVQDAMEAADLVICRSGYSTIMDLIAVRRKALLIPTPGQTEQEYIANRLSSMALFFAVTQDSLSLEKNIPTAMSRNGFVNNNNFSVNQDFKQYVNLALLHPSISIPKRHIASP